MNRHELVECLRRLGDQLTSIASELRECRPDPFRDDLPAVWRHVEFPEELANIADANKPSKSQVEAFHRAVREHEARLRGRDPLDGAKLIAEHMRTAILDCWNLSGQEVARSAWGTLKAASTALDEAIWTAELERGELGRGEEKATAAIAAGFAHATRLAADDLDKMAAQLGVAATLAATTRPSDLISQKEAAALAGERGQPVSVYTITERINDETLEGFGEPRKVSRAEVLAKLHLLRKRKPPLRSAKKPAHKPPT